MLQRALLLIVASAACGTLHAEGGAIPAPKVDIPLAKARGERSLVLAGGCFWGVQAVFQHVRGVSTAVSGYSGGAPWTAHYQLVSLGMSGHAESVRVTYDPSRITLGRLLQVFFSVAHDPTQRNRQGPDVGTQYRSAIFYADEEQRRVVRGYIEQLDRSGIYPRPIATEMAPLKAFHTAESYHQDYATRHPDDPYIRANDAPKVANLRMRFPELYVDKQ